MATTAELKNGLCIKFNHDLMKVIEFQHVKPGKGAAFVRTRLKSLTNGRVLENTFPAGSGIDIVRIEIRPFQFLYKDDDGYNFMHAETFEQIALQEDLINGYEFLKDGLDGIEIMYHADEELPLSCDLPQFITLEVTYTEPGIRGDSTSSTVMKPATLETGAVVKVPLFVDMGEKIKVDTREKIYVERVK